MNKKAPLAGQTERKTTMASTKKGKLPVPTELDENGKIDAKNLDPIIYDGVTHAYWSFGEKVGQAFSDGKKIQG